MTALINVALSQAPVDQQDVPAPVDTLVEAGHNPVLAVQKTVEVVVVATPALTTPVLNLVAPV